MNSIAIMQPYFFPYIGYFQLISAVDKFLFYDDVDYIKNGWINRNKVLINGTSKYFSVPCRQVSSNKTIYDVKHALDERKRKKMLKKIRFAYSRAPFFESVYNIIKEVFEKETQFISELATESVMLCSNYLGIDCLFSKTSRKFDNTELDAADRLIDICHKEESTEYINAIGGTKLYEKDYFNEQGINLQFLEPGRIKYEQFGEEFMPGLSIIDVMMFNSPHKIRSEYLEDYTLK